MSESVPHTYPVKRPWSSLTGVLFVQAQNAFNDNFLKFVLISLAGVVAKGQWFGDNAQRVLAAFIPLAFILFSPIAGYLADRYSKRNVIFWCVIGQLAILVLTIIGIQIENLMLAVLCLFLLSIQSTFFSPAKQGILKELVGSRKLTMANGLMQMLTMAAILAGIGLGGSWFGMRKESGLDEWQSAFVPILAISLVASIPLLMKLIIAETPAHIGTKFKPAMLVLHFRHLSELFKVATMKRSALGIAFYWLVASFVGVILFDFGHALHPDAPGRAAQESSRLGVLLGVGIMTGSILVSVISRDGIRLGLVQIGGAGFALGLAGTGLVPVGTTGFYLSMVAIGFFGGFFIVPLSSFLQDIAPNEKRGRIMGASALLNSISGVIAILVSLAMTHFGVALGIQMLCFVIPTFLATWYVSALIKKGNIES